MNAILNQIENCPTWTTFAQNTGVAGYCSGGAGGVTTAGYTDSYFNSYWCYPHYTWVSSPTDRTAQAYRIVRALMKKGVLKITDLTDFFEAMDAVIEVI